MRKQFIILFLALVVLRLPALFHPVLDVDEAIYGLFARIWFDGGIPYVDCVETKPLGIYFLFGVIFEFFGKYNMIAVHAVTIVIVGLTAYVILLIAKLLYSPSPQPLPVRQAGSPSRHCGVGGQARGEGDYTHIPSPSMGEGKGEGESIGFWAALLYIVFTTTYFPKIIATTIEPVMLLPVSLQFYYWMKYERGGCGRHAFLSGLFFATACCFKYQAGMNLIVLLVYWLIRRFASSPRPSPSRHYSVGRQARGEGEGSGGLVLFALGALIPPAIMIAYLAGIGGALSAFLFWNVAGSMEYIEGGSSAISLLKQLRGRVLPYVASTVLLWVLAITNVAAKFTSPKSSKASFAATNNKQEWLIIFWFLFTIIPVSAGFRFYGHYFLLLLPPMSILAAAQLYELWKNASRKFLKAAVLTLIILPAVGFTIARFYITEIHVAVGEDNLEDYKPLGEYVKTNTKEGDRIVAWGFAPMIYWNAERLPATRFFWSDLLTGRTPGRRSDQPQIVDDGRLKQEYWKMFFDDLERHMPVYIIDTAPAGLHDYKDFPISRYPAFMDYLTRNYKKETIINDVIFYRRVE